MPVRLVGINHVALEVGDIDEALAWYGRIFQFTLRGKGKTNAFIDMGDQFIALMEGPIRAARGHRHFGFVVDDRTAVAPLTLCTRRQSCSAPASAPAP